MSIEAIHYVMKTDIPDGIAKLVAFVIADYAHAETGQAWPKIETLARKCSQSVRTVQRKIRVLEELSILRVEQRHAETGRQRENLFVLYLPGVPRPTANDPAPPRPEARTARGEGDTQSPIPPPDPVDPVTPGGVSPVTPEGDTAVTPRGIPQKESIRGVRSEPSGSAPRSGPAPRDFRSDLRSRGVETLRDLTGWTTARAHSRIGQWLSESGEDAGMVLAVIDEAIEVEPLDASAWIAARLKRRKAEAAAALNDPQPSPSARPRAGAAQPRPPANGAIALFLRRMGASDVRPDSVRAAADLGPVIDHRADGHPDPDVQQPAGRSSDGPAPEAHARHAGARR
ncbi:helix-turn-helix domain-containing protein [Methylobacterium sp. J-070]|uniref:helix-turn-helix domain-containing protein n=1 Tax=Methylobacterium sp. J-070 TaxID=2836650 RepID=UPI001FB9299E|nr:helix-turn-helix domain-containing protein [Methylobacterium sp. J-070]MCJ2051707.1 helix-turn-helix domain-containing protein [Methylobacterium sp. J-070]